MNQPVAINKTVGAAVIAAAITLIALTGGLASAEPPIVASDPAVSSLIPAPIVATATPQDTQAIASRIETSNLRKETLRDVKAAITNQDMGAASTIIADNPGLYGLAQASPTTTPNPDRNIAGNLQATQASSKLASQKTAVANQALKSSTDYAVSNVEGLMPPIVGEPVGTLLTMGKDDRASLSPTPNPSIGRTGSPLISIVSATPTATPQKLSSSGTSASLK